MTASTKAGRYELIEEIGRGAMGIVYRANDPVIGRPVAVKTMRLADPGNGLSHEDLLSRFQTEARAAGRLTHPNMVVVYDAGEEDGVLYITMELVDGPSLQALIEARQTFPLTRILRLMEQACSALDYAHQHNIIHRDIKPANLMLTADDALKITDFGTAKILQFGTMQTAQTIGTPSYMSPEQIKGRPVDGRTDLFSLGVVLYELVTGQKPFPGDSVTTVIYKIVNESPVPPRELDSSIHPGLSAVITKALAKPPEARFQNCREFLEALQQYAKYQDPAANATVVLPRGTLPSAPAVEAGRMLAARGGVRTQVPATGRTQHPAGRTQHPLVAGSARKSSGAAWLVIILLAVIGAAGYQVLPALEEVWQRSQPDRAAAENALRSAALTPKTETSAAPTSTTADAPEASDQPHTVGSQDVKPQPPEAQETPQTASTAKAVEEPPTHVTPSNSTAAPANLGRPVPQAPLPVKETLAPSRPSTTGPDKDAASATKETTVAGAGTTKPSHVPATPAAAEWQTRISRILDQSGIDGQVQALASGNTITLTGKLRLAAHRGLLARLQDVPERIQVVDDIEYDLGQAPDAPDGIPATATPSSGPSR